MSGTLRDDASSLCGASEIVAGYVTFMPAICLLLDHVKRVFFFRDTQQMPRLKASGIQVITISDASEGCIAKGQWLSTPEQLAKMINYRISSLGFPQDYTSGGFVND
jgi:hypothetical protein